MYYQLINGKAVPLHPAPFLASREGGSSSDMIAYVPYVPHAYMHAEIMVREKLTWGICILEPGATVTAAAATP